VVGSALGKKVRVPGESFEEVYTMPRTVEELEDALAAAEKALARKDELLTTAARAFGIIERVLAAIQDSLDPSRGSYGKPVNTEDEQKEKQE
jgi:hypothetical protein